MRQRHLAIAHTLPVPTHCILYTGMSDVSLTRTLRLSQTNRVGAAAMKESVSLAIDHACAVAGKLLF